MVSSALETRPPRDQHDWDELVAVNVEAFTDDRDNAQRRVAFWRSNPDTLVLVAAEGERVVGGAVAHTAGQWFGERTVPALVVTSVGVRLDGRRRGAAAALMARLRREGRERNLAIAPLWSATTRFYRRWGWELGDRLHRHHLPAAVLARLTGGGRLTSQVDVGAARALQSEYARAWDGPLARPAWWFDRHRAHRARPEHRYLFGWEENGRLTGYVRFDHRTASPGADPEVWATDLAALTPGALAGLLGVLGGHETQSQTVSFSHCALPPRPALLFLLPDADKVTRTETLWPWMQRILDVPRALTGRGWPVSVRGRLELEVHDPFVGGAERLVVDFEDGHAQVRPGGPGTVSIGVGALAAWYVGSCPARAAVRLGMFQADGATVALMDQLTGNRPLWLCDDF